MQMTKPRATFVQGVDGDSDVWIVTGHGMGTMHESLDEAIKRHTIKLIRRINGSREVHKAHYPQLHE